jgi:hypothetical protein
VYHSRRWSFMSGVLTAVLAAFALVIPPSQPSVWWWRGIVIALTALAIGTLGRSIMLQPIPRPHRLRSLAERFICDLSKAKRTDNFGNRAAELNYEFQKEGIYDPRFPKLGGQPSRDELNRAAVCFKEMLNGLPY